MPNTAEKQQERKKQRISRLKQAASQHRILCFVKKNNADNAMELEKPRRFVAPGEKFVKENADNATEMELEKPRIVRDPEPETSFWAWSHGEPNRHEDALSLLLLGETGEKVIDADGETMSCNSSGVVLGYHIAKEMNATAPLRFGFATTLSAAMKINNVDDVVQTVRNHFDLIILSSDTDWECDDATEPIERKKLIEFATAYTLKGGKCYPPISRLMSTIDKGRRDRIMDEVMLPHETLHLVSGFEDWALLEHYRETLFVETVTKLSRTKKDKKDVEEYIDSSKLVLKSRIGNSCHGVVLACAVEGEDTWRFEWVVRPRKSISIGNIPEGIYRVEPFIPKLQKEEHHFFVWKTGGVYGQTQTHICYHHWSYCEEENGVIARFLPVDMPPNGALRPSILPEHGQSSLELPIPQKPTMDFLRKALLCFQQNRVDDSNTSAWDIDGLVFRVDAGVIRTSEGKFVAYFLNEIGLVPVEENFLYEEGEVSRLSAMAKPIASYIESHLHAWLG